MKRNEYERKVEKLQKRYTKLGNLRNKLADQMNGIMEQIAKLRKEYFNKSNSEFE